MVQIVRLKRVAWALPLASPQTCLYLLLEFGAGMERHDASRFDFNGLTRSGVSAWACCLRPDVKVTAESVDAFTVNGSYACMLSGMGFDAQVAHDFAQKSSRGLFTYTQQSIIQFFKANPYQFEIVLDNFSFFTDAFFISIANSNQFGNNAIIAPQASLSDGLLDIVIVQKMNKAKLPFAILRQMRGNNKVQQLVEDMSTKNILYFQTPSLRIKNPKLAPLHIDGEPRDAVEEIQVEIIPKAFLLIKPKVK
jgi:diacylglycerol kinase (ATP)